MLVCNVFLLIHFCEVENCSYPILLSGNWSTETSPRSHRKSVMGWGTELRWLKWHIMSKDLHREKILGTRGLFNLLQKGRTRTSGWKLKPNTCKLEIRQTFVSQWVWLTIGTNYDSWEYTPVSTMNSIFFKKQYVIVQHSFWIIRYSLEQELEPIFSIFRECPNHWAKESSTLAFSLARWIFNYFCDMEHLQQETLRESHP